MNVEGNEKGIKEEGTRNPPQRSHAAEIECKYQMVTLHEITNVLQPLA